MHLSKDPDAVLDYEWDWADWLPDGDSINTATIIGHGVTIDQHTHTATTVTAWLSGGGPSRYARATCRITTQQGRADDRTITLSIGHR